MKGFKGTTDDRQQTTVNKIICRGLWSVVCGLIFILFFASATSFNLISTYQTQANTVAVDNFSNFYTAADNNIYKYTA